MSDDIRGSTETGRLACLSERGTFQLPDAEGMAAGMVTEVGHRTPCSPVEAARRLIASGIFDQIAAEMTRIDREIKARATPRPPFEEVLAKSGAKFIAMKGWGL